MIEIMHLNMTLCCKKCQFISWAHNLHHRIMINLLFYFYFLFEHILTTHQKQLKPTLKLKKQKIQDKHHTYRYYDLVHKTMDKNT